MRRLQHTDAAVASSLHQETQAFVWPSKEPARVNLMLKSDRCQSSGGRAAQPGSETGLHPSAGESQPWSCDVHLME